MAKVGSVARNTRFQGGKRKIGAPLEQSTRREKSNESCGPEALSRQRRQLSSLPLSSQANKPAPHAAILAATVQSKQMRQR